MKPCESDLKNLLKIFKRFSLQIFLSTASGALIAIGLCSALPTFRGYEALIELPTLVPVEKLVTTHLKFMAVLASELTLEGAEGAGLVDEELQGSQIEDRPKAGSSRAIGAALDAWAGKPSTLLKDEIQNYLQFKHVDQPRRLFDDSAHLKSVTDIEGSANYLTLLFYSKDEKEVEVALSTVAADIDRVASNRIDIVRTTVIKNMDFLRQRIAEIETGLASAAHRPEVEFSPLLLARESSLKRTKVTFEELLQQYELGQSGIYLHPTRVLGIRQYQTGPVFPKRLKLTAGMAALGLVLTFLFLALAPSRNNELSIP